MEPLAIVFDAQTGVLHKHGSATRVNQWLEEMQEKIMARGINPLAMPFAIIYMPRTQSNLDHLNKAIGTTGYALNLIPPDPKSTRFH